MNGLGRVQIIANISSWYKDGIPYNHFTDDFTINITPGHQSGFRFAPSEFIKRVTGDNDVFNI